MEPWKRVWRNAVSKLISLQGLEALRHALIVDDSRLLQGATTSPPPLQAVQNWPVEAACVIGYCGWQSEHLESVADVEEYFAQKCFDIDNMLNEYAGCRWFLNWFDETPRNEMRHLLLEEVELTINSLKEGVS